MKIERFASGKTTGVVVEIGDGVTQVVPVFDGYSLQYAQQRIDLGGRDITEHLSLLLRRSGYAFHTSVSLNSIIKRIVGVLISNMNRQKWIL